MIRDRIKRLRERQALSVTGFAKKIGLSKSAVSQIESGETKEPKALHVHRIAAFFNVSTDWLITGIGSENRLRLSEEETNLIIAIRKCDPKTKAIVFQIASLNQNEKNAA